MRQVQHSVFSSVVSTLACPLGRNYRFDEWSRPAVNLKCHVVIRVEVFDHGFTVDHGLSVCPAVRQLPPHGIEGVVMPSNVAELVPLEKAVCVVNDATVSLDLKRQHYSPIWIYVHELSLSVLHRTDATNRVVRTIPNNIEFMYFTDEVARIALRRVRDSRRFRRRLAGILVGLLSEDEIRELFFQEEWTRIAAVPHHA